MSGVADAEAFCDAGTIVFDQRIGARREPAHEIAPVLLLHVDDDAALIAIEIDERRGETRSFGTAGAPHRVAFGRFDLDDIGAQIAKQLRAERSGHDLGEIEDANTSERAVSHRFVSLIPRIEGNTDSIRTRGQHVTRRPIVRFRIAIVAGYRAALAESAAGFGTSIP